MYTVKQEQPMTRTIENGNIVTNYLVHIIVDTVSDIPAAKDNWLAGSRCDVLEDGGHVYELSHSREWCEVNFFNRVSESGNTDLSNYYTKSQIDKKITDEVAKIVAEAPEDFDTLKEFADWISNHAESVLEMNSIITSLTTEVDNKVDKVQGKNLSTNDFTDVLKAKLTSLGNYNDSELRAKINSLSATVGYQKRNLVPVIQPETDLYIDGITFTFGNDGVVTANGIATNNICLKITEDISDYKTTDLFLSGCPMGGSFQFGYSLRVANSDSSSEFFCEDIGFGNFFSIPPHINRWCVYCCISAGTTVNNLTFNPMVRYATDNDNTHTPYIPSIAEYIDILQKSINNITNQLFDIGTFIPMGADLDDYTKAGVYTCDSDITAYTLLNNPHQTSGFRLEVVNTAQTSDSFIQKLFPDEMGVFYIRTHDVNGFGSWFMFQGVEL
ncbi:MAG: hypothetical protein K2O52_02335 [Oscillospiraceae bacterium]|nr:hypothetical protein [Oscillospiraceae bacterium]